MSAKRSIAPPMEGEIIRSPSKVFADAAQEGLDMAKEYRKLVGRLRREGYVEMYSFVFYGQDIISDLPPTSASQKKGVRFTRVWVDILRVFDVLETEKGDIITGTGDYTPMCRFKFHGRMVFLPTPPWEKGKVMNYLIFVKVRNPHLEITQIEGKV